MSSRFPILSALLVLAASLAAPLAQANPRPLPFSYPYETLPTGKVEVEQYTDLVPVRVARENPDGTEEGVFGVRSVLTTELEFGITDRLEFGWYFAFRQGASATTPFLRFQGVKQRLRLRIAEEGELPVNLGLYLEIAEFYDEFEVEEKILISRRFGPLNLVLNLWVEQEYYFQTKETKHLYNPTAGVSYELSPQWIVGAEYWVRGRFDSTDPSDLAEGSEAPTGARHYLGPTFLYQTGELFLSFGTYLRLDGLAEDAVVNDPYGKLWFRSLIGFGF